MGCAKRSGSPSSATSPTAVSVSIPRRQPADQPGPQLVLGQLNQHPVHALAAREEAVVAVQVVGERDLRRDVIQAQPAQPIAMPTGPRVTRAGVAQAAAQHELRQPVASTHQIAAQIFAAAHRVAELLELNRRDGDDLQVPGGQQPRELQRVVLVGLDAL